MGEQTRLASPTEFWPLLAHTIDRRAFSSRNLRGFLSSRQDPEAVSANIKGQPSTTGKGKGIGKSGWHGTEADSWYLGRRSFSTTRLRRAFRRAFSSGRQGVAEQLQVAASMKGQRPYSSSTEAAPKAADGSTGKVVGRHGIAADPWYFGIPRSGAKEQEKAER
jgi:hypothetical protein